MDWFVDTSWLLLPYMDSGVTCCCLQLLCLCESKVQCVSRTAGLGETGVEGGDAGLGEDSYDSPEQVSYAIKIRVDDATEQIMSPLLNVNSFIYIVTLTIM